jgi:hypothetical protein
MQHIIVEDAECHKSFLTTTNIMDALGVEKYAMLL